MTGFLTYAPLKNQIFYAERIFFYFYATFRLNIRVIVI